RIVCQCTITDRSRSPLSENTIRRVVEEEYLDESFVSNVGIVILTTTLRYECLQTDHRELIA
ncbi:hypothetical protein J6590_003812, partial [Homalodisca vitripennis]